MARNKYADLDPEYQERIQGMSDSEIRNHVSEVNLELQKLLNAKQEDEDLKEKAEEYKEAGRVYREGAKGAKLRTQFALEILEARGQA